MEEEGLHDGVNGHEDRNGKSEIFTKVVRAGKRTYFFDVKATKRDDYYLTITESKKRLGKEGKIFYEKHKIFLYKEDFDKFREGLSGAISHIGYGNLPSGYEKPAETKSFHEEEPTVIDAGFSDIEFEDLGRK